MVISLCVGRNEQVVRAALFGMRRCRKRCALVSFLSAASVLGDRTERLIAYRQFRWRTTQGRGPQSFHR